MPYESWDGVPPVPGYEQRGYCTHMSVLFLSWHRPWLALYEVCQQYLGDHRAFTKSLSANPLRPYSVYRYPVQNRKRDCSLHRCRKKIPHPLLGLGIHTTSWRGRLSSQCSVTVGGHQWSIRNPDNRQPAVFLPVPTLRCGQTFNSSGKH